MTAMSKSQGREETCLKRYCLQVLAKPVVPPSQWGGGGGGGEGGGCRPYFKLLNKYFITCLH